MYSGDVYKITAILLTGSDLKPLGVVEKNLTFHYIKAQFGISFE